MAKKTSAPSSSPAAPRARRSTKAGNGAVTPKPTPEEIAEAAYHRYLSRGGQDGADFDDWIEAERDLTKQRTR